MYMAKSTILSYDYDNLHFMGITHAMLVYKVPNIYYAILLFMQYSHMIMITIVLWETKCVILKYRVPNIHYVIFHSCNTCMHLQICHCLPCA
jgi:hypothetical protein